MTDDPLLAALDQVPFILAVCEGPELRVIGLSAATRAVLPGREWAGRPIREVISDLVGQQFVDAYHEVYRTGVPVEGQEWRAHLDRPDGSVHEMWANFTITPWHDETGTRRGVIGVGFDVTETVRQRAAATALRERYDESRATVTALQRALLPAGLPVLPGLRVAASYLLADADTAAGGDWFDAVAQRDGRVALIVGDVVGHGVPASGVMGQLRAVLRDRLDDGAGILEALAAADRFAGRTPGAHATTVCLVELDPVSGEMTYCTAGHPPPLVVSPGGTTRFLPGTGGTPLATGGSFPVGAARLGPGDLLLLYTDGIVERPGRGYAAGAAELARVAADTAAGRALREPGMSAADRVCGQAVELLVRATGHTDDITLLAAARVPVVPDLAVDVPAGTTSLGGVRAAIGAWLAELGAVAPDTFAVQHAVGELVTNAVEHAEAVAEVRGTLNPAGQVEVSVRDQGVWRQPRRTANRGRGLALAAQLVESLKVEPSALGTVARVRHTLQRPVRLPSAPFVPAGPAPAFRIVDQPGDDETRLIIEGPLDAVNAPEVRRELLRRSRGGTVPLSVDLTGVTALASAGVSVLHEVAAMHTEQKVPLHLAAAEGSPAQIILALVGLPVIHRA